MTKTLDEQIQTFINNNLTLHKIKNEENCSHKQIQELRYNLNSLFIACLINKVSAIAHFTIRKFSLDGRLRFVVTENNHEMSKETNQHSVTYAYLIADYLNKYLDNQYELDPKNISCAYDKFAETWTLTTDIPAL